MSKNASRQYRARVRKWMPQMVKNSAAVEAEHRRKNAIRMNRAAAEDQMGNPYRTSLHTGEPLTVVPSFLRGSDFQPYDWIDPKTIERIADRPTSGIRVVQQAEPEATSNDHLTNPTAKPPTKRDARMVKLWRKEQAEAARRKQRSRVVRKQRRQAESKQHGAGKQAA